MDIIIFELQLKKIVFSIKHLAYFYLPYVSVLWAIYNTYYISLTIIIVLVIFNISTNPYFNGSTYYNIDYLLNIGLEDKMKNIEI